MSERVKYLIVHERCLDTELASRNTTQGRRLEVNLAHNCIDELKDLPAEIIDAQSMLNQSVLNKLPDTIVLFDNVCAFDLEQSGAAKLFVSGADKVILMGAYRDICVEGARSVMENLHINHEISQEGTIRLFDDDGNKFFNPDG